MTRPRLDGWSLRFAHRTADDDHRRWLESAYADLGEYPSWGTLGEDGLDQPESPFVDRWSRDRPDTTWDRLVYSDCGRRIPRRLSLSEADARTGWVRRVL